MTDDVITTMAAHAMSLSIRFFSDAQLRAHARAAFRHRWFNVVMSIDPKVASRR